MDLKHRTMKCRALLVFMFFPCIPFAADAEGGVTHGTDGVTVSAFLLGNKISFKCQDPWSHDRTVTFTGIVNAEALV